MEFINNVIKKIKEIKEENGELFFRGQSNYEWGLISSLSRKYYNDYSKCTTLEEKNRIILDLINEEIELYITFKEECKCDMDIIEESFKNKKNLKIVKGFDLNCEKNIVSLMQHYGYKTRYLDFTTNLLVALYFALPDDLNQEEPAALWILNKDKFNKRWLDKDTSTAPYSNLDKNLNVKIEYEKNYIDVLYNLQKLFQYKVSDGKNNYEKTLAGYVDMENEVLKNSFLEMIMDIDNKSVVGRERHSLIYEGGYNGGLNERLCRQSGLFIMQGLEPTYIEKEMEDDRDKTAKEPFIKIKIPSNEFENIKEYLEIMGINKKSIYNTCNM